MRKFLFSTSAIVSAFAFVPAAQAQLEVSVGGFTTFQAGFFDNKFANQSDRDFQNESEIHIKADGEADNGLKYGAKVELLASTSDSSNADETVIYVSGDWGRVELGDEDGASDQSAVLAPTVGIGQINGSYLDWVQPTSRPAGNIEDTGGGIIKPLDTDDSTKVTYYTPRMEGFQAGVSYVPESDDQNNGEQIQFSDSSGNQENAWELGLNYRNTYNNGVSVRAGLGYVVSDAKNSSGREDVSSWGLGARVGYAGFEVGGGYVDNGDSNNNSGVAKDSETAWNIGARYEQGPWGVAVSYLAEDYDTNGGRGVTTGGGDYDAFVLGGTYAIAEGLTASADLAFFDRNFRSGTDDDGYVLVLETKASF